MTNLKKKESKHYGNIITAVRQSSARDIIKECLSYYTSEHPPEFIKSPIEVVDQVLKSEKNHRDPTSLILTLRKEIALKSINSHFMEIAIKTAYRCSFNKIDFKSKYFYEVIARIGRLFTAILPFGTI